MTILDYPPIKEHSQLLLCSPCPEEMSILAHRSAETERQETRKGNNIRSILPVTGLATEIVQLPPKKKRYNIYIISTLTVLISQKKNRSEKTDRWK